MRIWLIKTGEPLPLEERRRDRLHRTGLLAQVLSSRGHEVTWWTSTFDHYGRRHFSAGDADVRSGETLIIRMLRGCGYRRNVSLGRIREHRQIARKFAAVAKGEARPDLILCAYPTMEFAREAVRYGRERRVPVVLDIRDLHPDIFAEMVPRWVRPLANLLLAPSRRRSGRICAGATALTGMTQETVDWGLRRGGRERSEWDRAFPFGYRTAQPAPESLSEAERFWDSLGVRDDGSFRACFLGTMGETLNVGQILDCAASLPSGTPIQFVLCGDGERLPEYRRRAAGMGGVILPGRIDAAQIWALMRRCSVGLDPLPDRFDFLASINNKAIEYLSAGLPVASCPRRGVLFEMLAREGCGVSWEADSGADLAGLLGRLTRDPGGLRAMSDRARNVFRERYDADVVYGGMADHLERLAEAWSQSGRGTAQGT